MLHYANENVNKCAIRYPPKRRTIGYLRGVGGGGSLFLHDSVFLSQKLCRNFFFRKHGLAQHFLLMVYFKFGKHI